MILCIHENGTVYVSLFSLIFINSWEIFIVSNIYLTGGGYWYKWLYKCDACSKKNKYEESIFFRWKIVIH